MKELLRAEKSVFNEIVKLGPDFASVGMLVHDTNKTSTTIRKHIKSLMNKGYIVAHNCHTYDCPLYMQTKEAKIWLS